MNKPKEITQEMFDEYIKSKKIKFKCNCCGGKKLLFVPQIFSLLDSSFSYIRVTEILPVVTLTCNNCGAIINVPLYNFNKNLLDEIDKNANS